MPRIKGFLNEEENESTAPKKRGRPGRKSGTTGKRTYTRRKKNGNPHLSMVTTRIPNDPFRAYQLGLMVGRNESLNPTA